MTIDEAIELYKNISKDYDEVGNTDDSADMLQIAEWLRQARGAEKAARWYTAKIRKLEEEIEGLRQELAIREESEQEKVIDYLSEQNVDWEDRYRKLVAENEKLKELVADYEHCIMRADCNKCKYDGKMSTHCPLSSCFPDTNELGIEVDE